MMEVLADSAEPAMLSSIYASVITTLCTMVFVGLVRWAFIGPKLKVLFREDEYGKIRTIDVLPGGTVKTPVASDVPQPPQEIVLHRSETRAEYVRIRVENHGFEAAKSCRAFLVDVQRLSEDGKWVRVFFDSIPLRWSYLPADQPQLIDIPRKTIFNADVFSTEEGRDQFFPSFYFIPTGYRDTFRQPGEFILTVVVAAENTRTKPKPIKLHVIWKGKWDDFSVRSIGEQETKFW
jgi:hypothetical protein